MALFEVNFLIINIAHAQANSIIWCKMVYYSSFKVVFDSVLDADGFMVYFQVSGKGYDACGGLQGR